MTTVEQGLGLTELADRVGISARTIRFYTDRGLLPAPQRRGRFAHYGPDHVARLELVRDLQTHGFTLAAIEGYLARIPADATPETVALHRTLLAPWQPDHTETVATRELTRRAGRALDRDELATLAALGVVTPVGRGRHAVTSNLSVGLAVLELGLPTETARATQAVFDAHGRAIAEELTEVFRTQVWPAYRDTGLPPEQLRRLVERFKPLTVAALVTAYQAAVDETKRAAAGRRTRTG